MSSSEATIDIDVPAGVAYAEWANLEKLAERLSAVDSITTGDGEVSHWTVSLAGIEREFDARVTEVVAGKRIAWKSVAGAHHAGVITFHELDEHRCRVALQLDFEPDDLIEKVADVLNLVEAMAEYDLGAFKAQVEAAHPVPAGGGS